VQLADVPASADWALQVRGGKRYARRCLACGWPTIGGGVRVSKLAASGAASADFYKSDDSQWQTQWKAVVSKIPADVYLIMLGGNDQGFGVKPEQYLENIKGLVRMIRESSSGGEHQSDPASGHHAIQRLSDVGLCPGLEPWARSQNIWGTQVCSAFGPDFKRYASDGPTPMIGPDKIHPIPGSGGRLISDFFYRLLVGTSTQAECKIITHRFRSVPDGLATLQFSAASDRDHGEFRH
jgi:hypothetical protein